VRSERGGSGETDESNTHEEKKPNGKVISPNVQALIASSAVALTGNPCTMEPETNRKRLTERHVSVAGVMKFRFTRSLMTTTIRSQLVCDTWTKMDPVSRVGARERHQMKRSSLSSHAEFDPILFPLHRNRISSHVYPSAHSLGAAAAMLFGVTASSAVQTRQKRDPLPPSLSRVSRPYCEITSLTKGPGYPCLAGMT
jgi:hypothetical protein